MDKDLKKQAFLVLSLKLFIVSSVVLRNPSFNQSSSFGGGVT